MGKQALPRFKIFSFYKGNVNPRVPKHQQSVFRLFGQKVHHIVREDLSHGDFLNHVCRTVKDTEYLIFFDVDCIPVGPGWLPKLLEELQEPRSIAGAAQTANHLRNGENLYVSPFFFGISTAYLKALNYPDMNMTADMDAGQNLTEQVIKDGGRVHYWWPTHVEVPEWRLHHPEHTVFGPGTTYDNLVYHAFLSRFDLADRFVIKAKSLLKGTFYGYRIPLIGKRMGS
jgi:hypothetical protein